MRDTEVIASKTYQYALPGGFKCDNELRALVTLALKRGWLRAFILYVDGIPCAFWNGLAYGGTFHGWTTGYDPGFARYRIGTFLLARLLENLCQDESINRIDFGFGDAEFKRNYCDELRHEATVCVYGPSLAAVCTNVAKTASTLAYKGTRRVLESTKTWQKVRRAWRARLQFNGAVKLINTGSSPITMKANVPGLATKDAATRRRSMRDAVAATTSKEIAALREDWSFLRSRYGTATPDADPDFFLDIYHALDEEVRPHVVVFRDDTAPYALIVGRLARKPITSRVGYFNLPSPHLQCLEIVYGGLITDGEPCSRRAVAGYVETLLSERAVDLVSVHHLPVENELMAELVPPPGSKVKIVCHREANWRLKLLDSTTGERTHHNTAKTRKGYRRLDRVLREQFDDRVELRTFRTTAEVEEFIEHAASIAAHTYQLALNVGVQNTERWQAIVHSIAKHGHLRGYLLTGNDKPIAYWLAAVFSQECTLLATGYLPEYRDLSPGTVCLNRALNALATEKVHTVDWGWGDSEYKRRHATDLRQHVTLHLYGDGWRPIAARGIERTAMGTSRFAARTIESFGILSRLKRIWRRRLERAESSCGGGGSGVGRASDGNALLTKMTRS